MTSFDTPIYSAPFPRAGRGLGEPPPMLLQLRSSAAQADRDALLQLCRELGYEVRTLDSDRRLVELTGSGAPAHRSRFEDLRCVQRVLEAGETTELFARAGRADTQVAIGAARFGGGAVSIIAGPCAVEDRERTLEIARAVQARGATALRGGAFKPRTSPYSFQGAGRAGLDILRAVRDEVGLAVVTEVLDPRDIDAVSEVADAFQVGSRSMQNFALLRELGRQRKPVLLKRGFSATVREFLLAAEFLLDGGNREVVLCERGIRGFDDVTRNVLDVGAVAHLKGATHLPIIVDPSHAAGRADLVRALARAGIAAGADGVLVEVHPRPDEAHSDGAQAISLSELERIVEDTRALCRLDGRELVSTEGARGRGAERALDKKEPVA